MKVKTQPVVIKPLAVIFISLLAVQIKSDDVVCSEMNSFIKTFPPGIVYVSPRSISEKGVGSRSCKPLWRSGTCCNVAKLAQFAEERNKDIDSAKGSLFENLNCIDNRVSAFQNKNEFHGKVLQQYQFLRRMSIGSEKLAFKEKASQCWNFMKNNRGAALCNSCAADSHKYFEFDKAIVSMETCDSMLLHCSQFFEEMVLFVNGLAKLYDRFDDLPTDNNEKLERLVNSLKVLNYKAQSHQILKEFKVLETTSDPKEKERAMQYVCDSLYVFNDKTFIEKIQPLMSLTCQKILGILEGLKTFKLLQIKKARSTYLINIPTLDENSLIDKNLVNTFLSDTTTLQIPRGKMAMNVTLIFP